MPFEHAISAAHSSVAADNSKLRRLKRDQLGLMGRWGWRARFADQEEVLDLRNRYNAALRQRSKHSTELRTAQDNVQMKIEISKEADLQVVSASWEALAVSKESLLQNWRANEDEWLKVAEKREEQEKKPDMGRFPLVVVLGMLLCWIGQWMWWAGYVKVAGDDYCPPSWSNMAAVWTLFSATGMSRNDALQIGFSLLTCNRFHDWGEFLMQDSTSNLDTLAHLLDHAPSVFLKTTPR